MIDSRTSTGLFDGLNILTPLVGHPREDRIITKVVIRNDDSASINPKVRVRNTTREGEDDEYINLLEGMTIATNHTAMWNLVPFTLRVTQELELELEADHTTTAPQWMISWIQDS